MNHPTSDELQEYNDCLCSASSRKEIEDHISVCPGCAVRLNKLKQIESVLRRVPYDKVLPDFTHRVVAQLRIKDVPTFGWSILKNLGSLIAIVIVVGTIYAGLKIFNVYDSSPIIESFQTTRTVYGNVGNSISNGISAFNGWMKNIFPFLYTGNYGLALFLVLLFGAVALLDKFIIIPIYKKRRISEFG